MTQQRLGFLAVAAAAAAFFSALAGAQDSSQQCLSKFSQGKEDFVLDTDVSVKEGAEFLGSPAAATVAECVSACCAKDDCNLALIETGAQEGSIQSCFIFNCLYKQKKACRFARKTGFRNYMLTSAFENYFTEYKPNVEDKPPVAIAGQDKVVQPNEPVILNGIESKDDHKIVDYHWEMVSGNPSAVVEKNLQYSDQVIVSNLSPGLYKFKLTVKDSAGQLDSAVITVLALTPEQTHNHCLVPKKAGPCRGSFPRWHYNAASEKCEQFIFGGCKENRNNYLSEQECIKACDKVSALSPPATGGRHGPINVPVETCGEPCQPDQFHCNDGCCIDKWLECDQVKQCSDGSDEEQCENWNEKFNILLKINVDEVKARCSQPPVTGPCRASFTHWYYNPYEGKCHPFNFGGCDGNDNRFESEENCMKFCRNVTGKDVFASRGIFEKQTEGNDGKAVYYGIAVSLVLAIMILVGVIGYCYLKGKNESRHQRVAVNGSYAYPVEDMDKLVYNSTTKPI